MNENKGCSNIPSACSDRTHGRCKAREEFQASAKPKKKRRSFSERLREVTPPEEIKAAEDAVRARARREKEKSRFIGERTY